MIKINLITYQISRKVELEDGSIIDDICDVIQAERELTYNEKLTVTSSVYNGVEVIHYQGDEPN